MRRLWIYAFSLAMIAWMSWPLFRPRVEGDSFPHSTFPMFSQKPHTHLKITHALGVKNRGERVPLPPIISSGNRAILQSQKVIWRGIRSDAAAYCEAVAERVKRDEDFDDIVEVELATSQFHIIHYFEKTPNPTQRHVHRRCAVKR